MLPSCRRMRPGPVASTQLQQPLLTTYVRKLTFHVESILALVVCLNQQLPNQDLVGGGLLVEGASQLHEDTLYLARFEILLDVVQVDEPILALKQRNIGGCWRYGREYSGRKIADEELFS